MRLPILGLALLIVIGLTVLHFSKNVVQAPEPPRNESKQELPAPTTDSKEFDKNQHSLTELGSLWIIVNKTRPIPLDYAPSNLATPKVTLNPRKTADENQLEQGAAKALEELFASAETAGHKLMLASGYRSAKLQATYYNSYVSRDGQAAADRYSAKPGTSEHQTGLSLDISRIDRSCYLEVCFDETAEGKWLADNVHKHGFILRYPEGKESVTGYQYEPWHFRFVGKELAQELFTTNKTVEEFFEL